MAVEIVDILGGDVRQSTVLARDCAFPIVDLTRKCPPDEVFRNIPVRIGAWEAGTVAPAITDFQHTITSPNPADACESPTVRTSIVTCELQAPDMEEISFKTPNLNWKDLRTQFCRQRNIVPNQLCVFNADGSLATGEPYTIDFIRFALASLNSVFAETVVYSALKGDGANVNQFDGLYNQLANGWAPNGATPCADEFNIAQSIDWGILTGTPGVPNGPDAVTVAGQTINLWGNVYNVPEGVNLAELMEDVLIDAVAINWADARGGVDMWEMHLPWGKAKCMLSVAACMQPCRTCGSGANAAANGVNFEDPGLRERFVSMMNGNMLELLPSGTQIAMLQSRYVDDNCIWLGPGSVGGRPTYALYWDNIDQYLDLFNQVGGDGFGLFDAQDAMLPEINDSRELANDFEQQAIYYSLERRTVKCLEAYLIACLGMLVCSRHLWFQVCNVACCSPACPADSRLTVDGVKLA